MPSDSLSRYNGGWVGGKLAGKMKPEILRWIVVTAGLIAAVAFFVKG